jgi:hypothetical protein
MSLDISAATSVLKETYPNGIVPIDYAESRTLALIKKEKGTLIEGPFGAGFAQPIKYGNPSAGSATYAVGYAESETESSRYKRWFLTPGELFQFARVSGQLIRRSAGSGSFIKALVSEIENAKTALTRMISIVLDRDGWGTLATIGSVSTSTVTTVTLTYPWMARFFEIGMSVCASASKNGAVLKSPTAAKYCKITAVDVSAGTLVLDKDMTTTSGTAFAANDYLFRYGDREDSASPTKLVPCGFQSFLPDAAGDRTTLFTVDQTLSARLGGLRRSATTSGGTIEEALLDASADIDAMGGKSTHCVLGTNTYAKLNKSLLNKVYADMEDMDGAALGFKGIVIQGASGDFVCYSDSAFSETRARLFNVADIGIIHTGDDLAFLDQTDGLQFREVPGTDDWMARLVSSFQFHLDAPGHAEVVTDL